MDSTLQSMNFDCKCAICGVAQARFYLNFKDSGPVFFCAREECRPERVVHHQSIDNPPKFVQISTNWGWNA